MMPCQLKKAKRKDLVEGRKEENILANHGSLICPPGKNMHYYNKQTLIRLGIVAIPGARPRDDN